jgi:amylosucrase
MNTEKLSFENKKTFEHRLNAHWPRLLGLLRGLYGDRGDFADISDRLRGIMAAAWAERAPVLRTLDAEREAEPAWFQSQEMVGGILYVDLFSDKLANLFEHIPYFTELGLTYLHLMPLFSVPHGDNDGGYAVSSYRAVNPDLGTMEELGRLAAVLRSEGISLVLDFVFNHTSNEHEWARRARSGDPFYREFYHTFADRTQPDRYEEHLREIFPTVRRGSFTWDEAMGRWVWTTFNSFQWDLNYANPAVFCAMAEEMLYLANAGVQVLRLDAVAFIWKEMGTSCENRPQAHQIIRAFNAVARIAAPSLLFKSEAIVHPDEVLGYIDRQECQLSYNPMLMALVWEAVATREVRLLEQAVKQRARLPAGCSWVNYLRCHDDIGWTFDDEDARWVGIDPAAHRRFLNAFYTGSHPGSFSRGVPFQYNPDTGDLRVSGTLASLAGLEQALEAGDPVLIQMAVRRIMMMRSIMLSIGGLPLIYLGDEWGMLNDYTYLSDPTKVGDSRWVHRSRKKWHIQRDFADPAALEWRFFNGLKQMVELRKKLPALENGGMAHFWTGNPHLFAYTRQTRGQRLLCVANFSEHRQVMSADRLTGYPAGVSFFDHVAGQRYPGAADLVLEPYQYRWMEVEEPLLTDADAGS